MTRPTRVLSLYEGFFAGGARVLHTDLIVGLHGPQQHSVLSIASEARRESTIQRMREDPRYLKLARAGIRVGTLGRTAAVEPPAPDTFSRRELLIAAQHVARADVILALKEQTLGLLLALRAARLMPDVPVVACLHRSDPGHSGQAVQWLREASAGGMLTATIACARSTDEAYAVALTPQTARHVIPNGIDLQRFRPGSSREIKRTRAGLGIPASAPVIVLAARFDAMKNPALFLRSVAAHSRLRPGTHYVVCGAGMSAGNEAFRSAVDESGIGTDVRVHALGIRDDMPSIYQVADVVALTSAFGEASPLCLIEGAACGATPVTTAVGDSARVVDGIGVVTNHEADDIALAWEDVLERRTTFRRIALAARPRIGREQMISRYRTVVGQLAQVERVAA